MVRETRAAACYRGQPIVFNEDDHFDFDRDDSKLHGLRSPRAPAGACSTIGCRARARNAAFRPCPWTGGSTPRKRAFFNLVAEMTGSAVRF
jgi:hypothetical protein